MRVSAVIPALDEAAEIASAIQSARDAGADEVIVVDGGSSDATAMCARDAGADHVLTAFRGRGLQLRAGAEAATGEALWFLHADARPPAGAADAIRAGLAKERSWGAFRVRHDAEGWMIRLADRRSRRTTLPYGDQGVFVTRAAYEAVGGMPEQALMEDLEFARRLRTRFGPPLRCVAELTVSARRWTARPFRTTLCWWSIPALYRLGVAPERLARWYGAGN
ncbi:MAG: TIGR04283 family arsenosugar biosynthesis glycosyltransferase [Planctomycetota bacterium]|nr:TIGR04283 family arsenosugar biosynthesis glycosyltransferase [Planctomycetota bacterium]